VARRKVADIVQVKLRIRAGLRRRLEREAEKNQQTLNSELVERLERSLRREDETERSRKLISQAAVAGAVAAKLSAGPIPPDPSIGRAYVAKLGREFGSLSDDDPRKIEARSRAREVMRWIKEAELEWAEMFKVSEEEQEERDRIEAEHDAEQEAALERLVEQRLREGQDKS
jgi:Arc-like DNA binding domain